MKTVIVLIAVFCFGCGHGKNTEPCLGCGSHVSIDAAACPKCGEPFPTETGRKAEGDRIVKQAIEDTTKELQEKWDEEDIRSGIKSAPRR